MFYEGFMKPTQIRTWCSSLLLKPNDYSLQPTTGQKILLQIFFWNCSGNILEFLKGILKFRKYPKNLCKTFPFSIKLQTRILNFQLKQKQNPGKMFLVSVLKYVLGNFSWKYLSWSHFIKVTRLSSRFYTLLKKSLHIISRGCSGKLLFWKFRNVPKKLTLVKILYSNSGCLI